MRPIKFRAWDSYNKRMCTGYDYAILFEGGTVVNHKAGIDFVNQLIPMQFTGLLDKNGKEIYEGDVWEADYNNLGRVEVVFSHVAFNLMRYSWTDGKVIGNIYENPKLLETKKSDEREYQDTTLDDPDIGDQ